MNNALLNLQNPSNAGNAFQQGYQISRENKRRDAYDNALSTLALNPNDEQAIQGLVKVDPKAGFDYANQQRQQQAQAQRAQYETEVKQRAAQGEQQAIAELAGFDWNAWKSISQQDKQALKQRNDYLGQAALAISQLPDEQRAAAWDAYAQQGAQLGYDDLGQYIGQYSPDSLNSMIANTGNVAKMLELDAPNYRVVPDGGALVNIDNSEAIKEFNRQSSQVALPEVGAVDGGYRFRGGDPSNKENWEKVGGSGGNATGSFQ
jgi:hypothetical protein